VPDTDPLQAQDWEAEAIRRYPSNYSAEKHHEETVQIWFLAAAGATFMTFLGLMLSTFGGIIEATLAFLLALGALAIGWFEVRQRRKALISWGIAVARERMREERDEGQRNAACTKG
jgi:hypothetical protein